MSFYNETRQKPEPFAVVLLGCVAVALIAGIGIWNMMWVDMAWTDFLTPRTGWESPGILTLCVVGSIGYAMHRSSQLMTKRIKSKTGEVFEVEIKGLEYFLTLIGSGPACWAFCWAYTWLLT